MIGQIMESVVSLTMGETGGPSCCIEVTQITLLSLNHCEEQRSHNGSLISFARIKSPGLVDVWLNLTL